MITLTMPLTTWQAEHGCGELPSGIVGCQLVLPCGLALPIFARFSAWVLKAVMQGKDFLTCIRDSDCVSLLHWLWYSGSQEWSEYVCFVWCFLEWSAVYFKVELVSYELADTLDGVNWSSHPCWLADRGSETGDTPGGPQTLWFGPSPDIYHICQPKIKSHTYKHKTWNVAWRFCFEGITFDSQHGYIGWLKQVTGHDFDAVPPVGH